MKDLLGGQLYTDVDKFAVRDHGASSSMVQMILIILTAVLVKVINLVMIITSM